MATRAKRSPRSTKKDATTTGTELPPIDGQQTRRGNRSRAQHSEHPDQPADSTVKHVPQPGETPGGFPQGEYDVTTPAPEGAKKQGDLTKAAIKNHIDAANVGAVQPIPEVVKAALATSRIGQADVIPVTEALPAGVNIEHQGPNRWRIHQVGLNRFGHGATFLEALGNYVLGAVVPAPFADPAAARAQLPPKLQAELAARDAAVASRGITAPAEPVPAQTKTVATKKRVAAAKRTGRKAAKR